MRGVGSLDSIQIKNVRSLKDTGEVALTPITLLVGENSSGKSTFLRLFPLIKQSISKRTDGPLLWAGDVDDYVDFGSFAETVTNDGSSTMTFSFSFSIANHASYRSTEILGGSSKLQNLTNKYPKTSKIHYSITVSQSKEHEYISQLNVQLNQSRFVFDFAPPDCMEGKQKITVDSTQIQRFSVRNKKWLLRYHVYSAKSEIFEYNLPDISGLVNSLRQNIAGDKFDIVNENGYYLSGFPEYSVGLMQFIGQCLCYGITWKEIQKALLVKKSKDLNFIEDLCHNIIENVNKDIYSRPGSKDECSSSILTAFKLLFFYDIFSNIEDYIGAYFRQVHYIAPLRATAERYYRLRNLAIDEVDYQGKNLAMFLSGLSEKRMKEFQHWTQKYFGFYLVVEKGGGHLSVKIALTNHGNPVNMSDTGFGYSQILPIITQIWDLSTNPRPRRFHHNEVPPLVIAIEQPELHLHPALQAKLVRAFLSSIPLAQENGYCLQLLIETHSETILNYFGTAIANGVLQNENVSVVLFNKDFQTNHTHVQISKYDQNGYLPDWPIGFFAPKEW